jgi:hypothetical protein
VGAVGLFPPIGTHEISNFISVIKAPVKKLVPVITLPVKSLYLMEPTKYALAVVVLSTKLVVLNPHVYVTVNVDAPHV